MTNAPSDQTSFVALDAAPEGWRAWRMGTQAGSAKPQPVASLQEARAIGAGLPVLIAGLDPSLPRGLLQQVPAKPAALVPQPAASAGLWTCPGLGQQNPLAVMNRASLAVDAFLSLNPDWDGVICLTGRTSHWMQISAEEVVSFQSCATQNLFAATGHSALPADLDTAILADVLSRPEKLASKLAQTEAEQALGQITEPQAATQAWSALLAAEVASTRPYWLGQQVAVIGTSAAVETYALALGEQGVPVTKADEAALMRFGFQRAWDRLKRA